MHDLLKKYAGKLVAAGLAAANGPGAPLMGGLDRKLTWNRPAPEIPVLEAVFQHLNINSLAFVRPAPPYDRIIGFLADRALAEAGRAGSEDPAVSRGRIIPQDCETRTFLHDLPVVDVFDAPAVTRALKQRKTVIVRETVSSGGVRSPAVIAPGTVSPEQGFIHISSVCFACFVKFFSDYLFTLKTGQPDPEMDAVFDQVMPFLQSPDPGLSPPDLRNPDLPAVEMPSPDMTAPDMTAPDMPAADLITPDLMTPNLPNPDRLTLDMPDPNMPDLMPGPFTSEKQVIDAMVQAGRKIVTAGLVDSFFGNISFCRNHTLYISQTGASLDDLAGYIDPVPLDGSSSAGITASSELSAHLETMARTGCRAILHGHPRFSVILSMDCDPDQKAACAFNTRCHTHCPVPRTVGTTPIVPGEVGTGTFGLCRTLPRACETSDTVIVYGHGVFATGHIDFIQPFSHLAAVEKYCKTRYLAQVKQLKRNRQGKTQP
jgi:ribulose-5-phosphate 4-epimerase/fuculose-1-phosphate aldolase